MPSKKTLWWIYSIVGLCLVGFGLSVLGEAIIAKIENRAWFWIGTLSLALVNAGLCFIGGAIHLKSSK